MYVALYYVVSSGISNLAYWWLVSAAELSATGARKILVDNSYILTVANWCVCLGLYILIGKIRKTPVKSIVSIKKEPPVVYWMIAALAMGCRLLVAVYYHFSLKTDVLARSIENAAVSNPDINTWLQAVLFVCCATFVAAFFEEILFRVLVMGELLKIMRPWAAIGLQAVVFGLVHGSLFQSIFAFFIGIVLGIIYYRTRNIKNAMTCHAVFNFSAFLMTGDLSVIGIIIFVISGILLVSLSMYYILNSVKENN